MNKQRLVAVCFTTDEKEVYRKVYYRQDQEPFIRSVFCGEMLCGWDFGIGEHQWDSFYKTEMGYTEAEDMEIFDIT